MLIKSAKFVISNTDIDKCPQDNLPEYAFIGRSNVGKSTLINTLCNNKNLAMTSSKPGKTLLINHFLINDSWYIVDLPGYGFAKRDHKARTQIQTVIEDYILGRKNMTNLFVLIDARLEPQQIDIEFMEWLGEHQIPFSIIFTKADKLKKGELDRNIKHYCNEMLKTWEGLPPFFISSAISKLGRDEILQYIEDLNNNTIIEYK